MQYPYSSAPHSRPITIDRSVLSSVYGLFALAMGLTAAGVYAGAVFALPILASGWVYLLFLAEFAIVFSARMWMRSSPLNYILFAVFPILSGLTITPFLMNIVASYANGYAIIANAVVATAFMAGAAAVFARSTTINMASMGGFLFMAVMGLIVAGLFQLFIPGLQTGTFELLVSGIGIVVFAGFTAYDVQRIQNASGTGASAFMLALSLYLDIFNLFLYLLRFMSATGGQRKDW